MTPLRFAPCLLALAACIRAPDVVMVDRATALAQQAAGSFDEVELRLIRTGVVPRPVPFTPEQLEALGVRPPTPVDDTEQTEADRMDDLLRSRCIGEGRDGLLVDTHASCLGASDRGEALLLVDRVNRARVQLWRWMKSERKGVSASDLQRTWRRTHARGVVCGGWMQRDDGGWEAKKC